MFEGLHCGICALQILSQFAVLPYWDLLAPGKLLQDTPAPKSQVGFPRKVAPLVSPLDLGPSEHRSETMGQRVALNVHPA